MNLSDLPAHRTGMSHGQPHRDPVVTHRGVGPQEDHELRLAGVALFQPGHRRGQSKVADARSQDSHCLLLAAVPVGSLRPAMPPRRLMDGLSNIFSSLSLKLSLLKYQQRRLVIDLAEAGKGARVRKERMISLAKHLMNPGIPRVRRTGADKIIVGAIAAEHLDTSENFPSGAPFHRGRGGDSASSLARTRAKNGPKIDGRVSCTCITHRREKSAGQPGLPGGLKCGIRDGVIL